MKTTIFTRYAGWTPDLSAAWQFVMKHVDEFDRPDIAISPIWIYEDGEEEKQHFEVTVSGDREVDE